VIGSFLLGLILEAETNIAFALMGFSGSLTTWSSFIINLEEDLGFRTRGRMVINLGCNYFMSILAAWLGIMIA
jgi:fluoride ion exporter CrcB/FEX